MKKLLFMTLLVIAGCCAEGCGKQSPSNTQPTNNSFSGYYLLPNGGYIDIVQEANGLYDIIAMRLVVINADNSYGVIPLNQMINISHINNSLVYLNGSVNFTNSNVKNSSNVSLTGNYITQLVISKNSGALSIEVFISSNQGIVFDQVVKE